MVGISPPEFEFDNELFSQVIDDHICTLSIASLRFYIVITCSINDRP